MNKITALRLTVPKNKKICSITSEKNKKKKRLVKTKKGDRAINNFIKFFKVYFDINKKKKNNKK